MSTCSLMALVLSSSISDEDDEEDVDEDMQNTISAFCIYEFTPLDDNNAAAPVVVVVVVVQKVTTAISFSSISGGYQLMDIGSNWISAGTRILRIEEIKRRFSTISTILAS